MLPTIGGIFCSKNSIYPFASKLARLEPQKTQNKNIPPIFRRSDFVIFAHLVVQIFDSGSAGLD